MNAFDQLLAAIPEDGDREAIRGFADKYPQLREGVLLRSDYSKKMDEVRDQVTLAGNWKKWREENWVDDAYGQNKGATKRELEKDRRIEELTQQIAAGGDVNFDELNSFLDEQMKSRGILTKTDFDAALAAKESAVQNLVDTNVKGYAYVATKIPVLLHKHAKEFNGEIFDPDEFVGAAVKAGMQDLDKFYDNYVAEKRATVLAEKHKAELDAAREEGRKTALLEQVTSRTGSMPVDSTGPEMGHFQERLSKPPEENKSAVSGDAVLGRGQIARQAAYAGDRKEAEGSVAA